MSASLHVPTNVEVLKLAPSASRARYKLSDKGKYGVALLERVPEIAKLIDQPEKIRWIRQLANASTSAFTKRLEKIGIDSVLAGKIIDLAQQHFALPFRSVSELVSEEQAAETTDLFERLTSVGLMYRGLALRCGTCLVQSFVELSATGARPTCPGCGADASYVIDQRRKSGLSVHYRSTLCWIGPPTAACCPPSPRLVTSSRRRRSVVSRSCTSSPVLTCTSRIST